MLIKQIIEFGSRGPEPPGRTRSVTPKTGYFHDITKIFKANVRVIYCLQLKIFQ